MNLKLPPGTARLKRPAKFAALLVLLLLLAACNRRAGTPVDPLEGPEDEAVVSTATTTRPANATSPAASTPLSESTPEPEADETRHPPTPTATWPAGSAQVPCGVLLPLLSPIQAPGKQEWTGSAADIAVPDSARPALERLLEAPETVGLVAFELGRESDGVYLNPDMPMPLASVVKIINLIAYAQAAAAGDLDPAEWITLDEVGQTFLPRSDLGAHNRAIDGLQDRQLIAFDPPATPLEEIPWMMIRHSSNAAADYLHLRLGQETIEQTIIDLGLDSHTAPCPWIGQFLTMANRQTAGDNRRAVQAFIDDPERYGRDAMRLAENYAYNEAYRASESDPGWRASLNTQLLFSDNLNAQASARDYASLMSRILQNDFPNGYANVLVRRALEWPMAFPVNQELFSTIGLKDGSLPGVLTTAYYAQRVEDGAPVVVVLFYRQLPRQTYRQWRQELPHDELAHWLLSEPTAIPMLRNALQPAD